MPFLASFSPGLTSVVTRSLKPPLTLRIHPPACTLSPSANRPASCFLTRTASRVSLTIYHFPPPSSLTLHSHPCPDLHLLPVLRLLSPSLSSCTSPPHPSRL
eukprot:scaffold274186_cov28-Tisochrysis_lutea.AAC.1